MWTLTTETTATLSTALIKTAQEVAAWAEFRQTLESIDIHYPGIDLASVRQDLIQRRGLDPAMIDYYDSEWRLWQAQLK